MYSRKLIQYTEDGDEEQEAANNSGNYGRNHTVSGKINIDLSSEDAIRQIPAEDLAKLCLRNEHELEFDPFKYSDRNDDAANYNMSHAIFSRPREVWEKVLATETFKKVRKMDLYNLLMLYPGRELDENCDVEALKRKADEPLGVDLPTIRHMCEPKSVIYNGKPAFVVFAEHKRTCVRTNQVN